MLTRLQHRVSLMTESRTTFQGGTYTTSWTSYSVEWANCQRDTSKEDCGQNKKQQYTKWKVLMRKNNNVTNKNRLVFEGSILSIESAQDPTARGRMIEVVCREEVT